MPASPVEAEATGQEFVEATFSGITFQVPLDVDSWPLNTILFCRGITAAGEVVVDATQLTTALRELLGAQWLAFASVARKKRQLVEASHVFAAAVGIPADAQVPSDVVFGGIPRLLTLLAHYPAQIESDLNHLWHIDYRDRWRFTRRGQRRLTLRQIHVRLNYPPTTDCALAVARNNGKRPLSDSAIAVMDLQYQLTGRRHPSRPMPEEQKQASDAQVAAEEKARADYAERQKQRESRQKAGLETARANARISQRGNARAQNAR